MAQIIPGILTNSETEYEKRLRVAEHNCDLIQIDVIDGKFADNITVGVDVISKYPISSHLEIQLMVLEPSGFIEELRNLDFVAKIIFPLESVEAIEENIYKIRRINKQVGISLNPDTPIAKVRKYGHDIDLLQLMSGKPGFSGQHIRADTYERIIDAKRLMPDLQVEIDIGVNFENAAKLAASGADFLVSTSALYNASDFRGAYESLSKIAQRKI